MGNPLTVQRKCYILGLIFWNYSFLNFIIFRPIVLSSIKAFLEKYHADDNRLFIAEYEVSEDVGEELIVGNEAVS